MDARFSADRNLGRLAKWLRILGYDTLYERGNADRDFFRKAKEYGRIALTRRRDLAGGTGSTRIVVVKADRIEAQIREVLAALNLEPDPARRMTRCVLCNTELDRVPKETVEGLVPAYVWGACDRFQRCRACGKIFWPGTHPQRIDQYLKTRIPSGRP